jgi:hypothetical protein
VKVMNGRLLIAVSLLVASCVITSCTSNQGAPKPDVGGSTGSGAATSVGAAGHDGTSGDAGTNGDATAGTSGGTAGGAAGNGPADAGGTAGSAGNALGKPDAASANGGAGGPFACSEMIGLWVMSQWWSTFESGVDDAAWQYIFVHHGYLEQWADPASPYWATKTISPCALNPEGPDRVIFLPFSLTLQTGAEWQGELSKVVDVIKTKFKSVKRIEFMTTLRSPGNQPCPNDNDPNVVVPAYVDQAIQNVADASGGVVTVGPKIEVADCKWWAGGTDLTGAGNTGVGQLYGAYYKDHR